MNETRRFKIARVIAGVVFVLAVVGFLLLNSSDQAVLVRTAVLSLGAAAVAIPIALLAAFCVARRTILSGVLLLTLIGLSVIPPFINVGCWDAAFGKLGWLTSVQGQILKPLVSGWSAAIWVHAIGLVPPFALLFSLALIAVRTFEDQARLDLSPAVIFFNITLRRLFPLFLMCVLWAVLVCSREIGVTDLYQIGTLAEQVYLGYSLGQINALAGSWSADEIAAAGALKWSVRGVLFLSLFAVSVLFFSTLSGFSKDCSSTLKGNVWATRPRGHWGHLLGAAGMLLLLVVVPVLNLVVQAGTEVILVDAQPRQAWLAGNVLASITKAATDFRSAFLWSGLIALAASTVTMIAATLICFAAKIRGEMFWGMIFLTAVLSGVSGPDIGSGLASFFSGLEFEFVFWIYDQTIWPAVISNVFFCWPLSVVVTWFAISQTTSDQLESAQVESIGYLGSVCEFGFRQNGPMLIGVWLLVAAVSFSELSASQMLLPPGIETVAQVTLGKLHAGVNETTAALSMLTIGWVVALAMVAWIIISRGNEIRGVSRSR